MPRQLAARARLSGRSSGGFATEGYGKGTADFVQDIVVDGTELLGQAALADGVQAITVDDGRGIHAYIGIDGNLDHFPGGKAELAVQAVRVAAAELTRAIKKARTTTDDPADLTRRLGRSLGRWLTRSSFLEGCPVSTVTLEVAPHSPELTAACRDAYAEWIGLVADDLVEHGVDAETARDLGTTVVAGIEGALLLARAEQSTAPLDRVTEQLARLLERAAR